MLPYKCETCDQRFSIKWRLLHHQKSHVADEKEATTNESDSSASSNPKKVILKNTEVLQDFSTHECPECHLSFVGKKQLERHARVHGDKKYYQCDRCYLAFFWKSNYNRHRKYSCVRRVFQCEKCNRTFNKKLHFLRHRNCHDKDKKTSEQDDLDDQGGDHIGEDLTEVDHTGEEPSTSNDQETETAVVVPQITSVRGRLRGPKRNLRYREKDVSPESKSDRNSGDDFYLVPDFEPKKKNLRSKYERKHKCDLCGLGFRFKCDLGRHRRTHDTVKPFPCNECDLGFNWKSNLVRHQKRMHLGHKKFHCDSCGEGFTKKYHLTRHRTNICEKSDNGQERVLRGNRHSDDCNCDGGSDSNPVVIQLQKTRDFDTAVKNERPSSKRKSHSSDNIHQTFKRQEVNIIYLHACYDEITPDSKEECNSEESLKKQSETLNIKDIYDCDFNNESQRRKADIEEPAKKRLKKERKEYVCSVCSRVFTRKSCHLQHERSHYKQSLKCEWCNRIFVRKAVFLKHQRLHISQKPFQCETCLCYFRQKSQLLQHRKIHCGLKPHECDVCKRKFNRKSVLVRHKMIHTGEKPFECEVCHLCFNQKSTLVQHLRIHTGLKPYRCKRCNYSFTQKWNYSRHKQKVHISGKTLSIKCNTCDSSFPRKRILIQHEKIHQKKRFVFHIYNTRSAKKRSTKKDKLKEDTKDTNRHEKNDSFQTPNHSSLNPDTDYCEIIEDFPSGISLPKVLEDTALQHEAEISGFPDHCVPVNIYMQKDYCIRRPCSEDNKNTGTKSQNVKEFNEDQGLKANEEVLLVDISGDIESTTTVKTKNSLDSEKKINIEECKKNKEEKVNKNQRTEKEITGVNVTEILSLGESKEACKINLNQEKNVVRRHHVEEDMNVFNEIENLNQEKNVVRSHHVEEEMNVFKETEMSSLKANKDEISEITTNEEKNAARNELTEEGISVNSLETSQIEDCKNGTSDINTKQQKNVVFGNQEVKEINDINTKELKECASEISRLNTSSLSEKIKDCKNPLEKVNNSGMAFVISDIKDIGNISEIAVLLKRCNEIAKPAKEGQDSFTDVEHQTIEGNLLADSTTEQQNKNDKQNDCSNEVSTIQIESVYGNIDFHSEETIASESKSMLFDENIVENKNKNILNHGNVESNKEVDDLCENTGESWEISSNRKFLQPIVSQSSEDAQETSSTQIAHKHDLIESKEIDTSNRTITRRRNSDIANIEYFQEISSEKTLYDTNFMENPPTHKASTGGNVSGRISTNSVKKSDGSNFTFNQLRDNAIAEEFTTRKHDFYSEESNKITSTKKVFENIERTLTENITSINRDQGTQINRKLCTMDSIESNHSPVQTNQIENGNKTPRILRRSKIAEESGRECIKSNHKTHRNKKRLKYCSTFGRTLTTEGRTYPEEESVRAALRSLKIRDDPDHHIGQGKVPNVIKENNEKISIKRKVYIFQTKVIESIVEIEKKEDHTSNLPHSTVNFSKRRPSACVIRPATKGLEYAVNDNLKETDLDYGKQEIVTVSLPSKISLFEERFSNAREDSKEIYSNLNAFRKYITNPLKKIQSDQKSAFRNATEEKVDKVQEIQIDLVNKRSVSGYTPQINNINAPNDQQESTNRKLVTVCKNDDSTQIEREIGFDEGNTSNVSKRDYCFRDIDFNVSNNKEVPESGDSALKEISNLQKAIEIPERETSLDENREFSEKPDQLPDIPPRECQADINDVLEEIHDDQKPIQCREVNNTQDSCKEICFNENSNNNENTSYVDSVLDDKHFNSIDQNHLPKSSIVGNSIHDATDNHVSSSGLGLDYDFPLDCSKTAQISSNRPEISSEIYLESERKETAENFDFLDFNTLSSPVRCSKSAIPPFSSFKNPNQYAETDTDSQHSSLFHRRIERSNSSDFVNDARTDLEFTPLQNMRPSTEYGKGFVSYQEFSENLSTPIKNYNDKSTRPFEPTSNFVFRDDTRPQYIPFENAYQQLSSTFPVSEGAQTIPSYAEAFSRPRITLSDTHLVFTDNNNYSHYQYEDYIQSFNRIGNSSTPSVEDIRSRNDIFRLQQMSSTEDYYRNEEISKQAESTRNGTEVTYKYQVLTPQIYENPVPEHYDYAFPTSCEEAYNYSVLQEKVHTYAVHHEEIHTVQDLIRLEKTCSYPAASTETSSTEFPSNNHHSTFNSDVPFYSNYFQTSVATNQDPVPLNVQPYEDAYGLSSQFSKFETEKNSRVPPKTPLQAPENLSLAKTRRTSETTIQVSREHPKLEVELSPIPLNSNKQIPKTPLRFKVQTPQGLFQTNTSTSHNSSGRNTLHTPQRGSMSALDIPNPPIRLVKPSPQYPANHPLGFAGNKGFPPIFTPSSSLQNKNRCFQDIDRHKRSSLEFDQNRRLNFDSTRRTPDIAFPKGIFIERLFRCDQCEYSYARKEDLIRHRFTAHEKFRVLKSTSFTFLQ